MLKPLCLHSGTCDYIIWSLISILNILNNQYDDPKDTLRIVHNGVYIAVSSLSNNGWIDGFQIQTALNQSEKVLLFLFPETSIFLFFLSV